MRGPKRLNFKWSLVVACEFSYLEWIPWSVKHGPISIDLIDKPEDTGTGVGMSVKWPRLAGGVGKGQPSYTRRGSATVSSLYSGISDEHFEVIRVTGYVVSLGEEETSV